jgi:hypothetical protein
MPSAKVGRANKTVEKSPMIGTAVR